MIRNFLSGKLNSSTKSKTITETKSISSTIEIPEDVRRQSNTWLTGPPGFGKSMTMLLMMMLDLANRVRFCLVDLHGKLFQLVKKWCAYKAYSDRKIVIVDLAEGRYMKSYNPFQWREGVERSVQVGGMVNAVVAGVWGGRDVGEHSNIFKLLTVLFTVIIEKHLTLLDGFTLFADRDKMKKAVKELKDPPIEALWSNLLKIGDGEWSRHISPAMTRIYRIICSEAMQWFLGQLDNTLKPTFEETVLMNFGKSGRLDHDAASVAAALWIHDLYQSSFQRERKYGKDPAPYYVYADEWWLVPTDHYAKIMFETRKQGLLLVLANHDIAQLRQTFGSNFAESIHTMTQIKIVFGGIGDEDNARLARELQVNKETLINLPKQHCFIKVGQQPAQLVRVPDVKDPHVAQSTIDAYEKKIAEKTGAVPIREIDRHHRMPQNEGKPSNGSWTDGWS